MGSEGKAGNRLRRSSIFSHGGIDDNPEFVQANHEQVVEKIGASDHKSPYHKRRASGITDLDPNNLHSSIGIDDVSSSVHDK